jgi:hypothetical protein
MNDLRTKLAFDTAGAPHQISAYFDRWDMDGDGVISKDEFAASLRAWDVASIKPKRVSVERVVSGPGLAAIYGYLRSHWAYWKERDAVFDTAFVDAEKDRRGAIVAKCASKGNKVCRTTPATHLPHTGHTTHTHTHTHARALHAHTHTHTPATHTHTSPSRHVLTPHRRAAPVSTGL